jgi:hypothetical protein
MALSALPHVRGERLARTACLPGRYDLLEKPDLPPPRRCFGITIVEGMGQWSPDPPDMNSCPQWRRSDCKAYETLGSSRFTVAVVTQRGRWGLSGWGTRAAQPRSALCIMPLTASM